MNSKFSRFDYLIFIFAVIAILVYSNFYPHIFPKAGIRLHLSYNEIENTAFGIVKDLGYDLTNYKMALNFMQDPDQISFLERKYGSKKANQMMKKEIPAYYWSMKWHKPMDLFEKFKSSSGNDDITITVSSEEMIQSVSKLNIQLSTAGKLLNFNANFENNTTRDTLNQQQAFKIATAFLQRVEDEKYEFVKQSIDSTITFYWKRNETVSSENVSVEIQVFQDKIVKFKKKYTIPEEYTRVEDRSNFVEIPRILVFMAYFILMIIVIVQKLRRDEISLKSGIGLGIVVGLSIAYTIIITAHQESFWEMLIPVLVAPIFVVFFLLAVVGVSDSIGREVWQDKLVTFDALNRLKVRSNLFSKSILRGIALAFITLGLVTVIFKLYGLFGHLSFTIKNWKISPSILIFPFLFALATAITRASFAEFIFRLFTISFLRKKLTSIWTIIIISGLLWTFNFIGEGNPIVNPIYLHIIVNFTIGAVFSYFFIKFDLMTVFIGSLLYKMIDECYPMLFWGDTYLAWNGIIIWIIIGFGILLAVIGLKKEIDEKEITEFVPPYVRRMEERERIKRELEIARKVQLSFLPREVPQIPGVDIATICIPANEVGGDYFDFLELDKNMLGIVIGDVSGKGIPAAFHMTLTKGFLRAQARENNSPREVLIRLNELFYENVARGIFISMIYGIFNIKEKTLTFARAGHNPIIIRSGGKDDIELLCPKGIALGLDRGDIFSKYIEEKQIESKQNDIFIFYTDGVSEAMNSKKIEFGEERLQNIIKANSQVSAKELIKIIQFKMNEFVGNTPQHDDMTMIVVKIS